MTELQMLSKIRQSSSPNWLRKAFLRTHFMKIRFDLFISYKHKLSLVRCLVDRA